MDSIKRSRVSAEGEQITCEFSWEAAGAPVQFMVCISVKLRDGRVKNIGHVASCFPGQGDSDPLIYGFVNRAFGPVQVAVLRRSLGAEEAIAFQAADLVIDQWEGDRLRARVNGARV
jgi:hypothetical protein